MLYINKNLRSDLVMTKEVKLTFRKYATYFINTLVVFWLGNFLFPEHIYIQDYKALIVSSVLMLVLSLMYNLIFKSISKSVLKNYSGRFTFILMYSFLFSLIPINFLVVSELLPGFEIRGISTYLLLILVINWIPYNLPLKYTKTETAILRN
jgi:uncharacterized membrane protein YvlD (DUF360 family)